ncbi:hypothetical protein JK206_14260 [Gluconobacter cerinus]|nr:hypothetical protein [Gluconobacter cerinus]
MIWEGLAPWSAPAFSTLSRSQESRTARNFDCQLTEVYVRVAIFNRFTALGTPITQAVA